MSGWTTYSQLVKEEIKLATEDGRTIEDVASWEQAIVQAGDDEDRLLIIWDKLLALPVRADFPFVEPSHLAGIQALRSETVTLPVCSLDDEQLLNRLHGAWLGRCCGCALGKPVEGFMESHNDLSSRQRIKTYLTAIGKNEYPLCDYFPQQSPAQEKTGKTGCKPSTRESIAFMESDDDIRYTVLGQVILREHGIGFSSWDVANTWWQRLPYRDVCTAETQAYRNLVMRYSFQITKTPQDIDWDWVATHHNPYREWIGADIRVDSWGYACPGNSSLAAELAWRDARISHVKNGLYGAMFMAAMIATAFVCDDPLTIIHAGLAQIPTTSRLYAEMLQVIEICQNHD